MYAIMIMIFRDARTAVLHSLFQSAAVCPQRRDVQVLRSGDRRRYRSQRRHDGDGVLYDAESAHLRIENLQLFLHRRLYSRIHNETRRPRRAALSEG